MARQPCWCRRLRYIQCVINMHRCVFLAKMDQPNAS